MSGLSPKNRVKSDFFMAELEFMSKTKDNMMTMLMHTKKCLGDQSKNQSHLRIKAVQKYLSKMIGYLKNNITKIKTESNLSLDPIQNQETQIYAYYDMKIQELNEKLILAENQVQFAENIKKANDRQNTQNGMTNYKNLKISKQKRVLEKYIKAKYLANQRIQRTIDLMTEIQEVKQKKNIVSDDLMLALQLKNQRVSSREYCCLKKNIEHGRKSQSVQKYTISNKDIKQPSPLSLMLKHNYYLALFKQGFQRKLAKMKERNKQKGLINRQLSEAIQYQNKMNVLKHLKGKEQLDYEESLAKIELEAENLNRNIDEKLLALTSLRKLKSSHKSTEKSGKSNQYSNFKSLPKLH